MFFLISSWSTCSRYASVSTHMHQRVSPPSVPERLFPCALRMRYASFASVASPSLAVDLQRRVAQLDVAIYECVLCVPERVCTCVRLCFNEWIVMESTCVGVLCDRT